MVVFPAKVTSEQVYLQTPPLFKSQSMIALVGNKIAGLITGNHPVAHKDHHTM